MLMAERQSFAIAEDWRGGNQYAEQLRRKSEPTYSMQTQSRVRPRKSAKAFLGTVFLALGLIVVNLVVQSMVIQRDYDIRQLQGKIDNIKREMVATRIEMASLGSFDRIQEIAENKLGMKVADSSDYHSIAAVPAAASKPAPAYTRQNQPLDKENLWNRITAWVGNAGSTMAQNQ